MADNKQEGQARLKDEYLATDENLRHWGNLGFAQLTVFIAIEAGLISLIFQSAEILTSIEEIMLKTGALISVVLFWRMDERVFKYWEHFLSHAKKLEKPLGFSQYSGTPTRGFFNSHTATRILFLTLAVFWFVDFFLGVAWRFVS